MKLFIGSWLLCGLLSLGIVIKTNTHPITIMQATIITAGGIGSMTGVVISFAPYIAEICIANCEGGL
jgi:hypothetical protein